MNSNENRRTIRKLSLQEMREIYDGQMQEDFPPEEIKPFSSIRSMHERGEYLGLGMLSADGRVLAYAFLAASGAAGKAVLLDYLAVDKASRGEGIGTRMLYEIREICADTPVLIETEDPEYAFDEADRQKREKRIAFYFRNNALDTGVRVRVFGVEFVILQLMDPGKEPKEAYARKKLWELYHTILSPEQLETKVEFIR